MASGIIVVSSAFDPGRVTSLAVHEGFLDPTRCVALHGRRVELRQSWVIGGRKPSFGFSPQAIGSN